MIGNPSKVKEGGVIKNSNGLWLKGFSFNLKIATKNLTEIWAVPYGLNLAS